jgi:hypothetical protein
MRKKQRATVVATALALVSTIAFAAEPAASTQSSELRRFAAAARRAAELPGLPLSLSAAFEAAAVAAAPEAVSTKGMQMEAMPADGMIVAGRINASGELETGCFSTQAAADAFMRGAKAPATKVEH